MAKEIYQNEYVTVSVDDGIVRITQKVGGVVIVPMTLDGDLIFIKHKRHNGINLEFPRGFLEVNETHVDGAKRELFEETHLQSVGEFEFGRLLTDSGLIDDNIKCVLCRVSDISTLKLNNSEGVLQYIKLSKEEAIASVTEKKIIDSFSLSALMLVIANCK